MSEPPRFAVLPPHAAVWLLANLRRAGVDGGTVRAGAMSRRLAGRTDLADELEGAWRQLLASAGSVATSVCGSAEVVEAEVARSLSQEVTTTEAADMLACTNRWVRQLITDGRVTARKAGSTWLLDRGQVEALRDARRMA